MRFLFIFLTLVILLIGDRLAYVVLFCFSVYGFLFLLISSKWREKLSGFSMTQILILLLPLLVFFTWVYGVLLGLSKGVVVEHAFSNFAGLSVYLIFYVFFFWVDLETSRKALFWASIIASVFALYSVLERAVTGDLVVSGDSISSGRVVFSGAFLYVVPFLLMYLMSISPGESFTPTVGKVALINKIKKFFLFMVFSFTLIVPALSKGFILVYCFLFFLFFIVGSCYACIEKRTNRIFLILFFFVFLFALGLLLWTDFFEIMIFSLSSKEASNSVRSEQFDYLLNEWSIEGAGLGSSLISGYSRDETGYGFELTYINIVHKLGVFALPLFASYIVPVVFGFKCIFTKGRRVIGGWVLGLMAYLVPGAANPMLLAPEFVVMHFIALMTVVYGVKGCSSRNLFLSFGRDIL